MPNLVGIGNEQVPTNAMLGGLAYQDPAHANLTSVEIEKIAAIKAKTADTAVDVFVYDTRKDSDGGAWRHRTQNTSWYNEGASATRGARKEFPAVAVIVATTDTYTIYDGDDPNMSMWMVFESDASSAARVARSGTSAITMMNGLMCAVRSGSQRGAGLASFIDDTGYQISNSGKYLNIGGSDGLINRNVTGGWTGINPTYAVTGNGTMYDVAMIVRPNAPIDETTGLPIPTIAIATNVGASIIQDNGFTIDKGTSGAIAYKIAWMGPNRLVFVAPQYYGIFNDPLSHEASSYISSISHSNYIHSNITTHDWMNYPALPFAIASGEVGLATIDHRTLASGHTTGLAIRQLSVNSGLDDNSGMVAGINHEYNTGWMFGDIRGAWLASTDDTNLNKSSLQAAAHATLDSTFDTSNGWSGHSGSNDWSISGGKATCNGNNSQRFLYPTGNMFAIGTSVVIEVTVTDYQSGTLAVSYNTGNVTSGTNMTGNGTYKFVYEITGNQIWYLRSDSFQGKVDTVYAYAAEPDRSNDANGFHDTGLIVHGTVHKTHVADGADLVYYSNFSNTNYFELPYRSDLNFGTGDFYVMYWVNFTQNNAYDTIMARRAHNGSAYTGQGWYIEMGGNNNVTMKDSASNVSRAALDGDQIYDTWQHHCFMRKDGHGYSFRNGVMTANFYYPWTTDLDNTNATLTIGRGTISGSGDADKTKLSLVRVGVGAPTEEQVMKIYNDEKQLFKEDAKCTLYGSSSDVNATAYDDSTNILHAGTSAGRSDFSGLRRINNTTAAVTTAISASNEIIAEQ